MKNAIAVIGAIIIVAACVYGIYKQVDDFNKENEARGVSYTEKAPNKMVI